MTSPHGDQYAPPPPPSDAPVTNTGALPVPYTSSAPHPGYGAAPVPGWDQAPTPERWNVLAVVSPVLFFLFAPAAVVTSIIALIQIRRTGERGRAIAITSLACGATMTVLFVLMLGVALIAMTPHPS